VGLKNFYFLLLLVLAGCASSETTTTVVEETVPMPIPSTGDPEAPEENTTVQAIQEAEKPAPDVAVLQADPLYAKASIFDRYLAGKLELEEAQKLIKSCHENQSDNLFCFSVVNYELLEQKLRARPREGANNGKGSRAMVRPRFKRSKLVNWHELRSATVAANLKGMGAISPSELNKVKAAAIAEKRCPNNAAIAVAATLEDQLPDRTSLEDLAELFEKGADCITNNPSDRENLLTRAGLFYYAKKDYKNAAKVLWRSAGTEEAFVARPLYWLYRARLELKETKKANQALEQLKARYPFSFHTLVAMTAAKKDPGEILSHDQPVAIRRSQKEPTVNSLIEQVEVLHRLGFDVSAARVLDWAINDFVDVEPELKVYLAELKKEQGDYRAKITILSDILYKHPSLISRRTMELYFPKVYFPIFEKNTPKLDPYLLLAIARRESAFNARAISVAKARGLMQIMPATGLRMGMKTKMLLDPESNVDVGSRYVFELLKKMNGQIHMALAAYNAGPQKLTAWTRRYESAISEPILFIDLIPYRETREYVASVLRNYYWYRRIHQNDDSMSPQRLLEMAKTDK